MDNINTFKSLAGNLLVATPFIGKGYFFYRSVIYILSHDEEGALGIVVNNAVNHISCSTVFENFGIYGYHPKSDIPVHLGGPVGYEKGLVLHTGDYRKNTLVSVNNVALSSNVEILKDIAAGNGPHRSIFALGYTGWNNGLLEKELAENHWIIAPYSEEIIFNTADHNKWYQAMQGLGINPYLFSSHIGHA
jgi:putative transcriptional regulator